MSPATNANRDTDAPAWHAISADEVVKRLASNGEKGLDAAEASVRLRKNGPNRLPEGKKRGPFMRFLAQFNNILVYVLLGAGFTKLMLNLWVDAAIIFGVIVLNALLGFIQEGKAEKALDSIRNMLSAEARTVRGGETRLIPAEQLVPGDLVVLESGDKIPADLRLIDTKNLRTEEAALTGESLPADKVTDVVPANATVPSQLAVANHRHVAHAMASHQEHQMSEIIPKGCGDQAVRHDVLYLHRRNWLTVLRKRAHDISFGDDAENGVVARHY